jgi:hypothetical protein
LASTTARGEADTTAARAKMGGECDGCRIPLALSMCICTARGRGLLDAYNRNHLQIVRYLYNIRDIFTPSVAHSRRKRTRVQRLDRARLIIFYIQSKRPSITLTPPHAPGSRRSIPAAPDVFSILTRQKMPSPAFGIHAGRSRAFSLPAHLSISRPILLLIG